MKKTYLAFVFIALGVTLCTVGYHYFPFTQLPTPTNYPWTGDLLSWQATKDHQAECELTTGVLKKIWFQFLYPECRGNITGEVYYSKWYKDRYVQVNSWFKYIFWFDKMSKKLEITSVDYDQELLVWVVYNEILGSWLSLWNDIFTEVSLHSRGEITVHIYRKIQWVKIEIFLGRTSIENLNPAFKKYMECWDFWNNWSSGSLREHCNETASLKDDFVALTERNFILNNKDIDDFTWILSSFKRVK